MTVATSVQTWPWFEVEEKTKTMEFRPFCPCVLQFSNAVIFGREFLELKDQPKRIPIAKTGQTMFYISFPYSSFAMATAAASVAAPSQPDGPIIVR